MSSPGRLAAPCYLDHDALAVADAGQRLRELVEGERRAQQRGGGVVLTGPGDDPVVDGEVTGRLRDDLQAGRPDARPFLDRGPGMACCPAAERPPRWTGSDALLPVPRPSLKKFHRRPLYWVSVPPTAGPRLCRWSRSSIRTPVPAAPEQGPRRNRSRYYGTSQLLNVSEILSANASSSLRSR